MFEIVNAGLYQIFDPLCGEIDIRKRLKTAGNAAHVFTSPDRLIVIACGNPTLLTANDTANIIADSVGADFAAVVAATD